eukprot:g24762.t1
MARILRKKSNLGILLHELPHHIQEHELSPRWRSIRSQRLLHLPTMAAIVQVVGRDGAIHGDGTGTAGINGIQAALLPAVGKFKASRWLGSWQRIPAAVQVTDVSPRDGLQNEAAGGLGGLGSAAAVLEPASPDDGTALGLQCMLRGSCHIQAFGRVEDLSYITGRHGSALLGEPEPSEDGKPRRLPQCPFHDFVSICDWIRAFGSRPSELSLQRVALVTQVTAMLDLITIFSAAGLQQELKAANGDKSLMISEGAEEPSFLEAAAQQVSVALDVVDGAWHITQDRAEREKRRRWKRARDRHEKSEKMPSKNFKRNGRGLSGAAAGFWMMGIAMLLDALRAVATQGSQGLLLLHPLAHHMSQMTQNLEEGEVRRVSQGDEAAWRRKRLQDEVPAFSGKRALKIIETELGKPASELFAEFDDKPLAAASLGQVHRAKTKDGTELAIKIQRDNLKEMYDLDLAQFDKIAVMLDKYKIGVEGASNVWVDMFEDAKVILYREIDYRAEAENTQRWYENFKNVKWTTSPRVIDEFTTSKVLALTFVAGTKISDLEKLKEQGFDRTQLAKNLAQAYLLAFCKFGFFNTDPHPGNLAVDDGYPGGRLIFYDFGQACELQDKQAGGILQVIQSIVDFEAADCVKAMDNLGCLKKGADSELCAALHAWLFYSCVFALVLQVLNLADLQGQDAPLESLQKAPIDPAVLTRNEMSRSNDPGGPPRGDGARRKESNAKHEAEATAPLSARSGRSEGAEFVREMVKGKEMNVLRADGSHMSVKCGLTRSLDTLRIKSGAETRHLSLNEVEKVLQGAGLAWLQHVPTAEYPF